MLGQTNTKTPLDGKEGADIVPILTFDLNHAIKVIKDTYGDVVSIKPKDLLKFGRNTLVGTSWATVASQPAGVLEETFATTNAISHFSSASTSDDGEEMVVEGHTVDGSGNFTFVAQTVTLDGRTETALTTPLARVTRVYNNGATNWVGPIYVYEDDTVSNGVPQTDAKIHLQTPAAENGSFKGATTISNNDYWIITSVSGSVNKKQTRAVDIELQIRMKGKTFRTVYEFAVASTGTTTFEKQFSPMIIVPSNADVRLRAISSDTNTEVAGSINGYLAIKEV